MFIKIYQIVEMAGSKYDWHIILFCLKYMLGKMR